MFVINFSREVFQPLAANLIYAEIGVYKGSYTSGVLKFNPKKVYLIDPWSAPEINDLIPSDYLGDPVADLNDAVKGYYIGGIQEALDKAYIEVVNKFSNEKCEIIKKKSSEAFTDFDDGSIDYLYIDGNHRYDFVLADLDRWASKISQQGFIVLNDCYVSPLGKKQHISVLEALSTFLKLNEWDVVACVNRDYTDVLITRRDNLSNIKSKILQILIGNRIQFLEIPSTLIHCLHHKIVRINNGNEPSRFEFMSFGA